MKMGKSLRWRSLQLATCDRGAALIEAAFAIPVLMILIVGGMELTHYVLVEMQLTRIAAMTADSASKLRTPMSESYVNQLFTGVNEAGASIKFTQQGRIILSSVQNNAAGQNGASTGQWIRWQRCWGTKSVAPNSKYGAEGKGQNDATLPTMNGLTAQPGSALMYAEIYYNYTPIIPQTLFNPGKLTHEVAFIVRQRTDYSISGNSPATC